MSEEEKDIKAIFWKAVECTSHQEQLAYLEKVCGSDAKARAQIEELLRAHEEAGDFLEAPVLGGEETLDMPPLCEGPGTVIGRYKLLEKIGEGGMAVVYMAEQEQPVRRKVALKIIKLGMDTKNVIARFEAERQALALMDHPNVAKIFDGGTTDTGRPYFVMELVRGVSITEYCDTNRLSPRERLELFVQVCQAVQHAHTKGIIHRDLKPSNVMVTLHDSRPVPKIIDFGIAKATNQRLTEKTLFTRYAQIIGTPEYMSPEQAQMSGLDVDTRTDIYSLGVLLYELLTGTTPFGEEELRRAGYLEMQRVIREQEPVKPSTKLSTLGETLTGIAKCRNSTPELLCKAIRGDLDWIVMKSLEKDRVRRYETASGLAEDIRRHLEHEPILARSPSAAYHLHRLLRKHRSGVLVAIAAVAVAAAVGVVLSLWNRDRLRLEETRGVRDQGLLSQAREQYAKAERDAALVTIKPILPSKHVGAEARLLQATILVDNRRSEEAVTVLNSLLRERPEIAGVAHSLLARILWESESLDAEKLKQIEDHHRQAETLLPDTAEAYFLRAMTAVTVKQQLAALDRALQLDSKHYESRRLRVFTYYASRKYDRMNEDAAIMETLRDRDPLGYGLRATALRELGRYKEAMAEYDSALARAPKEDPQCLDLTTQRLETLMRMGRYNDVMAMAQEAIKRWRDQPVFPYHMFGALTALGDFDRAAGVFQKIVDSGPPTARDEFRFWATKHVFDTLAAGRSWHPPDRKPAGAAFLPLVEAEETYYGLSAKGHRILTDGFNAQWSPDGTKLAFSLGVRGYSGVAVFDPATKETELLIVPGKNPRWSPDGRYIAFVRDRQFMRIQELATADPQNQTQPRPDEEVWLMKADGTEPRRLARGTWPSWHRDSTSIYYYSPLDYALYSISTGDSTIQPERVITEQLFHPSVSPDNRRVAYRSLDGLSLKVRDLASQILVAEWDLPFGIWSPPAWSPTGEELAVGAGGSAGDRTGLWICRLDRKEPVKVLDSQIMSAAWALDGTKLVFGLRPPYFELWATHLDPSLSTMKALGPSRTLDEHWRQMLDLYQERIKADPQDASAYSDRARYYDYLRERMKAGADMKRWSAAMSGRSLSDSWFSTLGDRRYVIHLPFNCELVFSAERPVNTIPIMSIAFGQKGRSEMKLFEIPMVVTSLLGFCFLPGPQVPAARADFTFGKRVDLGPTVNSPQNEGNPVISRNGLELYLASDRPGGYGANDIWMCKRARVEDPWGPAVNLGPGINSAGLEIPESISSDGLTLHITASTDATDADMYTATRPTIDAPWGPRVKMGPLLNSASDLGGTISPDDLELYFPSNRAGGMGAYDIWVSTRATRNDPWGPPVNLGPTINTPSNDSPASISPDGRILFIVTSRPGGFGGSDTWMARRPSKGAAWSAPVNLGPSFNTPNNDDLTCISADGRWAYFADMVGSVWMAPIIPIVDFNGDGKVDGKEVLALAQHWGQNDRLLDIGLRPMGDGIVDVNDLTALAGYIGQDVNDPTLIARWALDETAGITAADSAGYNNLTVFGNAVWQPASGKIGGALAFDGKGGFAASAKSVLDPAAGPFSVIAWVKGGAPNRVIVAQQAGADWLYLNQYGMLTTDLNASGRDSKSLTSTAYVLDDQWHRVVLTWDGTNRTLQMDGVQVARDTQPNLAASGGSLNLGAGKSLSPATFWLGLIDEVRIYNRAVGP